MKKLLLFSVILLICCSWLSAGVVAGKKGYAASVMIFDAGKADGRVLSKDGLFVMDIRDGIIFLKVFDKTGKEAISLNSPIASGRRNVIFQLERFHEPPQGIDGFRAYLLIDGKRVSENDNTRMTLSASSADLKVIDGVSGHPLEFPRTMTGAEIRRQMGVLIRRRWIPDTRSGRLLETSDLILNLKKMPGKGSSLIALYSKGIDAMLLSSDGLSWELRYKNAAGTTCYTVPEDFEHTVPEVKENNGVYHIKNIWKNQLFEVESNWTLAGRRLEADLSIRVIGQVSLEKVSFPRFQMIKLPGKNTAVMPHFSGREYHNPTDSFNYRAPWPNGRNSMQFFAVYNDKDKGVYFGREDASGEIKELICEGSGGLLDASWNVAVPRGTKELKLPGKGVMEVYDGRWFEAGQIYKKFVRTAPWWIEEIPRKNTPEWFMKNPFWLGNFDFFNEPGVVSVFQQAREFFGVTFPVVTGLLTSPDGKWHFGPDFIIKPGYLKYKKGINDAGVRIGTYYNCRLFYAGEDADKLFDYTNTGKPNAVKDEYGRQRFEYYGEKDTVMCPASPEWQKRLYRNISNIASQGVEVIYHDQLPCSTPYACSADNHGHEVVDPKAWLVKGHWQTYGRVMSELRKQYPEVAHTGEDASEAFLHCIDGFMVWRFGRPNHVPLFQSIFAPRIQFLGRGCDVNGVPGTYESFFPKYGEQLIFNEQIGLPHMDTIRYPSPRRNYLKKLAHLRLASVDFFIASEMMAPLKFRSKPQTMRCQWGVDELDPVTSDKILHCVWRNIDGRKMIIFLNTVNEEQSVEPLIRFDYKNMTACREIGEKVQKYGKTLPEKVTLAPYGVEFWFFDVKDDDADVKKVSEKFLFTAPLMSGDRWHLQQLKQDFSKNAETDAVAAPLYAKDVQWYLFAYRSERKTMGYLPNSREKDWAGGWMSASDGAVIYYGKTFIGKDSDGIEIDLACDQPGVKVELVDIHPNYYDVVLAEVTPDKGEWFTFKKYQVKWKNKTTNPRPHLVIRVKGGTCRIRSWKVIGAK